tara:strand:- start:405 stop:611 length:207 start_codon:yes stop_codon:yes gene_type:complete
MSRKKFFIRSLKQILKELKNGGARRDRTADLNTASVALSQLSYSPVSMIELLYLPELNQKGLKNNKIK